MWQAKGHRCGYHNLQPRIPANMAVQLLQPLWGGEASKGS